MNSREEELSRSLRLFRVLARAYRNVAEHSIRDSKAHGLNATEFAVLEFLYHKGEQPLQKIGSQLLLVSGNVTYVVDNLQKQELLVRKPNKEDRRVIYAALTDKGKSFLNSIFPVHADKIVQSLSGLDAAEQEQLTVLLKKLGLEAQRLLLQGKDASD